MFVIFQGRRVRRGPQDILGLEVDPDLLDQPVSVGHPGLADTVALSELVEELFWLDLWDPEASEVCICM